jgi:hypothetical protein
VAAVWRIKINLIHLSKGQRRERDKGMKGIKERWKRLKNEDTKE